LGTTSAMTPQSLWYETPAGFSPGATSLTHPFLDRLSSKTLVADGAMGTLIHDAGVPMGTCFDILNLSNPDLIGASHRSYLSAGADLIVTNT
jgi:methionine synthase I (cobalamin-dependent)